MHGSLHFELGLWKTAAENLKKAQVVYENLMQTLPEDEQTVYRAKVDELTPSLRYCAYNIGENASIDDLLEMRSQGLLENLSTLVAQTKTESSEAFQTTEWRGRKVTVKPDKVRLFFIGIQDITKMVEKAKTTQAKIEILENVLIDCKDAIAALKEDNKQDPKFRTPGLDGQALTGAQYLLNYLSYTRLMLTLERNLYLVEQGKQTSEESNVAGGDKVEQVKKVKPQDLSRLYEIILQNITELQQLPGMETDTSYQAELESLAMSFKAFRCYYIALTLVNLKRWKEGVAMYERSTNYASVALKSKPKQFDLEKDLRQLIKSVEGSKYSAHAYSILEDDGSTEESVLYGRGQKSSKPLFERLSQYKEDPLLNSRNPNVFKLTPEMEPIPCKPLFFDLALNYFEFPSLDDKMETPGKKGAAAGGTAGVSGFVKGLFSWGGGAK
jgi:signal recognition particle subunit SRP68